MGIFDKACPQCTADNAAGAIRCACGFVFDAHDFDASRPSPKETAEEEGLFQEYLTARVAQAIEQATVAAHAADVEPESERRAIEAIRAQEAVEKAKSELSAQQAKTAKAAEAARKAELIIGAVPIKVSTPMAKVSRVKFGVAEVVEDDRLYKEYLVARRAQATEKSNSTTRSRAATTQPTTKKNDQAGSVVHDKDKWEIKSGVGKDSDRLKVKLPSTTTQPDRHPKLKRNGHTQPPPKSEIMALYSLQTMLDKKVPKKVAAKIGHQNVTDRRQIRAPSTLVPAMKVGIGVAAKTTAKGTKIIGKGIAKLISKTVQAAQDHTSKKAIPTLHAEVNTHSTRTRSRPSRSNKAKHTAVHAVVKPVQPNSPKRAKPQTTQRRTHNKPKVAAKKNSVTHSHPQAHAGAKISNKRPTPQKQSTPEKRLKPMVPKQASIPGAAFRAAQADKIARAVDASRAMEEVETNRDVFHASQSEKFDKALSTARLMQSFKTGRECPLCAGTLSEKDTHCACGWIASADGLEMPALVLDDQERIETVGLPEALTRPAECPVCTATVPAGVPSCGCGWAVPVDNGEMPPLALSADERSAIEHGEKIKRG